MRVIEHFTFLIAIIPAAIMVAFGFAVRWGHIDLNSTIGTTAGVMLPIGVAVALTVYAYCESRRKR